MNVSIGELARLTGLSVKTIRYWSDLGLVPAAGRSEAGYRRYDDTSLARLELVRALRELGLSIDTVRGVLDRRTTLGEVAAAHADAVDIHIRQLTLRRSVLRVIARSGSRPEEVRRMTAFARASADEARRIMEEFIASVFRGHEDDPFAAQMREALPELPAEPSDAQIDAWVELSTLVGEPSFRARVREMVVEGSRRRSAEAGAGDEATGKAGLAVVVKAGAALEQGIAPSSPQAAPIVAELVALLAAAAHEEDSPAYRRSLRAQLRTFTDTRVERYWHLIGVINGWPARPSAVPAYEWLIEALAD